MNWIVRVTIRSYSPIVHQLLQELLNVFHIVDAPSCSVGKAQRRIYRTTSDTSLRAIFNMTIFYFAFMIVNEHLGKNYNPQKQTAKKENNRSNRQEIEGFYFIQYGLTFVQPINVTAVDNTIVE
jgi:hypothetical protein